MRSTSTFKRSHRKLHTNCPSSCHITPQIATFQTRGHFSFATSPAPVPRGRVRRRRRRVPGRRVLFAPTFWRPAKRPKPAPEPVTQPSTASGSSSIGVSARRSAIRGSPRAQLPASRLCLVCWAHASYLEQSRSLEQEAIVFATATGKKHSQSNVRRTMGYVVDKANERRHEVGRHRCRDSRRTVSAARSRASCSPSGSPCQPSWRTAVGLSRGRRYGCTPTRCAATRTSTPSCGRSWRRGAANRGRKRRYGTRAVD
jgi:hypothetical protein